MSRKQLFYLTSDTLTAYDWRQGAFGPGQVFPASAAGLDAFAAWLQDPSEQRQRVPAYLLTDLIEEDFQRQLLPHVRGKAGRALLARRLGQLYRDTPYRGSNLLGREETGRRDDQLLFFALTNPALLQPWTDVLDQLSIPVAGIYSTSLLSIALVKKLALPHEHLLLVTQQSGGLRQSYYEQGELRFSRQTPAIALDGVAVNIALETEKTRQFLTSTRMLARGDVLHTVILAPTAQIAKLAQICENGIEVAYHFIDLQTASERVGLKTAPLLADALLLSLLGKRPPASHYPPGTLARHRHVQRTRTALYGASIALGTLAVIWSAVNLLGGLQDGSETTRLRQETASYQERYRQLMSGMPPAPAKTQTMKTAVTVERMLSSQAPEPGRLLAILSAALDGAPQVRLNQLHWNAGPPPARTTSGAQAAPQGQAAPAIASTLAGIPAAPAQALRLEADVDMPRNDYRSALAAITAFAQDLARQPRLRVEIEEAPLDLRPGVSLSGKSTAPAPDGHARFTVLLVWQP
ncbi:MULTISPECIES: hypothetical protein [unclassified Janthinobacterium]|uniref:hypothetical protein n=1 Tax=unclassified Janthinobacterium TaxID=2610881 RepID=UPI001609A5F2|nr:MULTISPECIES: hypothetical protein [unclassified Janthinobacterium]MBB5368653.1 hypothetical protein [Janthinobacterium sp. K2C7]MBB5381811.1 hypothetical protein [Janthinobacterium sp. K2Li3]MBB5387035.1 hypothetical protein [Janthinobacterium sp. K2E3]